VTLILAFCRVLFHEAGAGMITRNAKVRQQKKRNALRDPSRETSAVFARIPTWMRRALKKVLAFHQIVFAPNVSATYAKVSRVPNLKLC
jgi:hypothetical protein